MPIPAQTLSAEKVKHFRQDNGWSQELLAKASGLSLRTVQRVEKMVMFRLKRNLP